MAVMSLIATTLFESSSCVERRRELSENWGWTLLDSHESVGSAGDQSDYSMLGKSADSAPSANYGKVGCCSRSLSCPEQHSHRGGQVGARRA